MYQTLTGFLGHLKSPLSFNPDTNILPRSVFGGHVSAALGEDLLFDEYGNILNPNFMDYKVVGILDFPDPKIDFVELYEPGGVFGIKGIGEGSTCVAASAIVSAVYNAIGLHVDPPLTPDRVLDALKTKEE